MACMDNLNYDQYIDRMSQRILAPNYLMVGHRTAKSLDNLFRQIWSTRHFIYPQLLLRAPDDVTVFQVSLPLPSPRPSPSTQPAQWHPTEDGCLLAGLANGQLILWDLDPFLAGLEAGDCTWDHRKLNSDQESVDWNEENGFIPVVHWSAESSLQGGHQEEVPCRSNKIVLAVRQFNMEQYGPPVSASEI
jgi:hypothetical protein